MRKTDYVINRGDQSAAFTTGPQSLNDKKFKWPDVSFLTGVSYPRSIVREKDIKDGLANTYLVGEKNVNSTHYPDGLDWGDDGSLYLGDDTDIARMTNTAPLPDDNHEQKDIFSFGSLIPRAGTCFFATALSDHFPMISTRCCTAALVTGATAGRSIPRLLAPLNNCHANAPMKPIPEREKDVKSNDESLSPAEIVGWLEFACWTMVALAPFLYWVNGPAVSTDQFVVRTALVSLALTGGIVIRVAKWIRRESSHQQKNKKSDTDNAGKAGS